jgi:phospholipid/cholesterol/gamma-HCH transport system substrate-binding protein
MSREARVGIFVLVGLIILTYFTFRISKSGGVGQKGYRLAADFDTVAGLEPKSDVKMAGVPIGKVEDIRLVDGKPHLTLRIDKGVKVPADSSVSMQSQGLLGEKYVEIAPGKDSAHPLPDGARIANVTTSPSLDEIIRKVSGIADDVKRVSDAFAGSMGTEEGKASLKEIVENVRVATASLRKIIAGNEERIDRIVANVDRLSADLKEIAAQNKENLQATVANARAFSEDLKEISAANKENLRVTVANLRDISETLKKESPDLAKKVSSAADRLAAMAEEIRGTVSENRSALKETVENVRHASGRLDNTIEQAGKVVAKIERGEGTLGMLISDNTAHNSLTGTLEGIGRYLRKGESLRTFVDYRLEWLQRPSDTKHYVDVRLQPAADKYYLLGIVDDPRGRREAVDTYLTTEGVGTTVVHEEKYTNQLKISALLAKRFDRLTVRGGVMESSGGLGVDYAVLPGKGTLTFDAFDFGRKGERPHLKAFGDFDVVRNFFLTAGVDDFAAKNSSLRSFFLGFGLKFADDDLKTVLGAVPLKP